MVSGEPLRPLRGNPQRTASQKRSEIFTAVNQSNKEEFTAVNQFNKPVGPKGDHLLFDLHSECLQGLLCDLINMKSYHSASYYYLPMTMIFILAVSMLVKSV